ncbi:MAG: Nudix family hydrolase [Ectothiorhodospiraceae bacterium AqS1]|nr:Nudix family hydrolase [Ectothiorhodospiraceae bacterium AqS1]
MSRASSSAAVPMHVVAGVVFDPEGRRVLVARRMHGRFSGRREFPGGKVEPGESRFECLARELEEEVGIHIKDARPLIRLRHRYFDKEIDLDIWRVESFRGEAEGCEGQPIEWLPVEALEPADFLPANEAVIAALRLPSRYLITPEPQGDARAFLDRLAQRVDEGFDLLQLRAKTIEKEEDFLVLARNAQAICRRSGARLLVNASPAAALRCDAAGVHLDSKRLSDLAQAKPGAADIEALEALRDKGGLIAASCHNEEEIDLLPDLGCDFAVLGPVRRTATHLEAKALGWEGFSALAHRSRIPIFALGGLEDSDIPVAHEYGAQGVAAIRGFWGD